MEGNQQSIHQIRGTVSIEDFKVAFLLKFFLSYSYASMIARFGEFSSKKIKEMPNTIREWKENGLEEGQKIMNTNERENYDTIRKK